MGQRPIRRGWNITPEVKVLLHGKTEAQGVQGAPTKTWKRLDEDFAYHSIKFTYLPFHSKKTCQNPSMRQMSVTVTEIIIIKIAVTLCYSH